MNWYKKASLDDDYELAIEQKDMPLANQMVADAAKRAGFTMGPLYRAENAGRGIMGDAIKDGIYFFDNKDSASLWAGDKGIVFSAFIRPGVVKDVHVPIGSLTRNTDTIDPHSGLQGVDADTIIRRFVDSDSIAEVVVFSQSQIKSSKPISLDDQGKIIPLSKRFDPNNPDIRF